MQSRLVRSQNDVVIAGVCGGLGEYFRVDPVIVRLIFVLVTLTSGIGAVVYPVLWMIMPKRSAGDPAPPAFADPSQAADAQAAAFSRRTGEAQYAESTGFSSAVGSSAAASGTPRETGYADTPAERPQTGQTIDLRLDPTMAPTSITTPGAPPAAPQSPRRRLNWAGVFLIGVGVIFLAEQFGIDSDVVFPMLMIGLGALLMFRHR